MRFLRRRCTLSASRTRLISLAPLTVLELGPPELVAWAADAGLSVLGRLDLLRADL